MTLYAGETVRIKVTADDFDHETPLTDVEVEDMLLAIFLNGVEVVAETQMVYDAPSGGWIYLWDTNDVDPGTYLARIKAVGPGVNPTRSLEYKRVRLSRNPV